MKIPSETPVFHYTIELRPHEELSRSISSIRKNFAQEFSCDEVRSFPSITLVSFNQVHSFEQKLLSRLAGVASRQSPMRITLQNFGSVPTHSIYINIATQTELLELSKEIRVHAQMLMKWEKEKPLFITEPNIKIAYRLKPWQYEKGWLKYSHSTFHGSFVANGFMLIRRQDGIPGVTMIKQFLFEGQPQAIQSSLFYNT